MTIYADAYAANVYVSDVPASALDLPLVDTDGAPLTWAATVTASFVDPVGHSTALAADLVTDNPDAPVIRVTWPSPSLFTLDGLGWVLAVVQADAAADGTQTVDPHPVIVENPMGWLTIAHARQLWTEAPEDPRELYNYLFSARRACIEEAPWVDVPVPDPDWRNAQLIQARNTWEANRSGGQDTLGSGDFAIPRHPLDWQVRQLLRPRSADARNVVT